MRKTISVVALVIFLLTSCSSVQPLPTPTDTPTSTATATVTSLPTATPTQATSTPKPTATATTIGPSAEKLNQILLGAGLEFMENTTNTLVNEQGRELCTFRYSKGILKRSRIDYIQYPIEVLDFMCYNLWAKMFSIQRNNAPYLSEKFSSIPKESLNQKFEIQREMRQLARDILSHHESVPYMYWTKNGIVLKNNISGIEVNYLSKDEFNEVKDGLEKMSAIYSSQPDWWAFSEEDQKKYPNYREAKTLLVFQGNKMLVYYYYWGGLQDRQPGGITNERNGYTALEFMEPKEREYMYKSLDRLYRGLVDSIKGLSVPENEFTARWDEIGNDSYGGNPRILYGPDNRLEEDAKETLSPLYKRTPTPSPTP